MSNTTPAKTIIAFYLSAPDLVVPNEDGSRRLKVGDTLKVEAAGLAFAKKFGGGK